MEGQKDVVGLLLSTDPVVVDVERMERRENADDGEVAVLDVQRLADAVRTGEELLVGAVVDDRNLFALLVRTAVPRMSELERKLEHGEEVCRDEPHRIVVRTADFAVRVNDGPRTEAHRLANRDLRPPQLDGIAIGDLRRYGMTVRLAVGHERTVQVPVIEPHVEELLTFSGKRITHV